MLRLFGSSGRGQRPTGTRTPHGDRRATCRYLAVEHNAMLAWRSGEGFQEGHTLFVDVSQSGGLIVVAELPPIDEVFLRLVRPHETDWAPARVCRVLARRRGMYRLGIQFTRTCDYELFRALRGYYSEARSEPAAPEFDGRYWK